MFKRLWQTSPELVATTVLMLVVLAGAIVGLSIDPRVITGAPAWLKPAKFAVSIAIYTATLAWIFTLLPEWPRTRRIVGWATAAALVIEMLIIGGQAWRGTTSHFNASTPLDGVLWVIMGLAIVAQTLLSVAVAVALWKQRFHDAALGWALRLGMTLTIVGAFTGGLMTRPTTAQLEAARAGERMTIAGAHTVGGADGGPGMAGTGWSREHGDLRVPHFVGLHAVQALPVFALLLRRRRLADHGTRAPGDRRRHELRDVVRHPAGAGVEGRPGRRTGHNDDGAAGCVGSGDGVGPRAGAVTAGPSREHLDREPTWSAHVEVPRVRAAWRVGIEAVRAQPFVQVIDGLLARLDETDVERRRIRQVGAAFHQRQHQPGIVEEDAEAGVPRVVDRCARVRVARRLEPEVGLEEPSRGLDVRDREIQVIHRHGYRILYPPPGRPSANGVAAVAMVWRLWSCRLPNYVGRPCPVVWFTPAHPSRFQRRARR